MTSKQVGVIEIVLLILIAVFAYLTFYLGLEKAIAIYGVIMIVAWFLFVWLPMLQ